MKDDTLTPMFVSIHEHIDDQGRHVNIDTATQPVTILPGDSCYMQYLINGTSKIYYRTARKDPEMLQATMQVSKIYMHSREVSLKPFTLVPNGCPLPDGQPMQQWGE